MKNTKTFEGIEPDVDLTYDSHIIDLQKPFTAAEKVRQEHQLRDLTEEWYWKGFNDALDKVRELLDARRSGREA